MLTPHKNANPLNDADIRKTLRTLGLVADSMSRGSTGLLNVKWHGAVGDGIADDSKAIQRAIDSLAAYGEETGLFFPPGRYRVTAPLVVSGFIRGLSIQGSGRGFTDAGTQYGSQIVGDGLGATDPVLDLNGTDSFVIRDLAIRGCATDTLTGAAGFGIRLRTVAGGGSGDGLFENVEVTWCDQGINCGNGGDPSNAADCSFLRVNVSHCNTAFCSETSQALNYDFYGFIAGFCADVFVLYGGNLYASMVTTYDVQRLVYVIGSGGNIGHTTIVNARLDGGTYRPVIYETETGASVTWATLMDVHCIVGQPSTGAARIKLTRDNSCKVIGGANLCGSEGPLFDLDGTGAACNILIEGAELPDNPAQVVGTVTGASKYRVRNCFSDGFGTRTFLVDYEN